MKLYRSSIEPVRDNDGEIPWNIKTKRTGLTSTLVRIRMTEQSQIY